MESLVGVGDQPPNADAGHLRWYRTIVLTTLSGRAKQPDYFFPALSPGRNRSLEQQGSMSQAQLFNRGQLLHSDKHGTGSAGIAGKRRG